MQNVKLTHLPTKQQEQYVIQLVHYNDGYKEDQTVL